MHKRKGDCDMIGCPICNDNKPRMTTEEILADYNNLPVDISAVEWVLADAYAQLQKENEELRVELWQAKGALGYPVPGHIPCSTTLKCGMCEARAIAERDGKDYSDLLAPLYNALAKIKAKGEL